MNKNIQTMVETLEDNEFLLPVGYTDSDGNVHRRGTLRPMTGETEEAIADPKVRDNGGKVITELLYSVVESLGTLPRINKDVIRDLCTIDRDYLLLKNRQVSLGDTTSYDEVCPHCRGRNAITINLADMPVTYMDEEEPKEITFELYNGILDKGTIHRTITILLPTGRIQEKVAQIVRSNPAQATTAMLQLITKKIGTLEYLSPEVFKKMTKKDRDLISNKLAEVNYGTKLSATVVCTECGTDFETSIPLSALLGE